ncbi:hypothetical protein Hanom_Chr02g00162731 [Helianthus anomalus]
MATPYHLNPYHRTPTVSCDQNHPHHLNRYHRPTTPAHSSDLSHPRFETNLFGEESVAGKKVGLLGYYRPNLKHQNPNHITLHNQNITNQI